MNVWKSFSNWQQGRYEQKVIKAKEEGKCPDCNGKGFHVMSVDHMSVAPFHCAGCNGSGMYFDWQK